MCRTGLQILSVVLFFLLWEFGSWAGWISEFLIGRPSGIWKIFVMMMSDGSLLVDSGYTLYEAMLGFVVGTALGSVMGLAMWYSVRSEEHTSELQSLMRISYAVFCLKKTKLQYIILTH